MQKIHNSSNEPRIFASEAVSELETALAAHFRLENDERHKRRAPRADFIFKDQEVRGALQLMSHGKCAFCEQHLGYEGGHVGGYRPGSNASSSLDSAGSIDHYAWLFHRWENLLLLCESCNQAKSNQFPVAGPRALPMGTWREAEAEESALLINPRYDDPSIDLAFNVHGLAVGKTRRGETTIQVLDLNRFNLVQDRARVLATAWATLTQVDILDQIEVWLAPAVPWSGVLRCFLVSVIEHAYLAEIVPRIAGSEVERFVDLHARLSPVQLRALPLATRPTSAKNPVRRSPRKWFAHDVRRQPQLREIYLRNFKGISELTIPLNAQQSESGLPSLMLLGENSTGKSSVLQAIALACMPSGLHKSLPISPEEFIPREPGSWRIDWARAPELRLRFLDSEDAVLTFDRSGSTITRQSGPDCLVLAYGSRRFFVPESRRRAASNPSRTLFDPLATLPDPKNWLHSLDDKQFSAVARALRDVLALRRDDRILRDGETVLVEAHGRVTPIERMSDGYRSLFATVCDIFRSLLIYFDNLEYARGLVLIDEVEAHLHPRWKKKVMSSLREALPYVQFITTTHDPLCLRGMNNGEVQVMYREPSGAVVLLEDLPDVSLLRAEQLLTSRYFGRSSTADEEQESILMELAHLSSFSDQALTPEKRDRRDALLDQYGGIPVLGDSPDRQILAQALTEHLRLPAVPFARELNASQDSVQKLVDLLDRALLP